MALRIKVRLVSSRDVELSRLYLLPSFVDHGPKRIVDQLRELIEQYFGTGVPWLIKNPRDTDLPITCIALFESKPMISHAMQIENSLLIICWFMETIDLPLRNIACTGLSDVEWEKHAKDFHSDW